jgi:saccharopine dehydrogenase-like NADP-dependent oxidoreductase
MAGNNDARFLRNGRVVEVATENLFKHPFSVEYPGVGKLEVYPNRDSLSYIDIYNIPEAKTMYRGTFRFQGWCVTINALKKLRMLSSEKLNLSGKTYADFTAMMIGAAGTSDIRQKVAEHIKQRYNSYPLKAMEWLGLFDNIKMNRGDDSAFEVLSDLMISKMMLKDEERDMVVLQHNFLASYKDGKKEIIRSRMLDFGTPAKSTAIARTVALPAAISAEMILKGEIKLKGVHIPVVAELYNPILDNLEKMNIKVTEEWGLPVSERIQH